MVRDPQLVARLARLSSEVAIDAAALSARSTETDGLLRAWPKGSPLARAELMLIAANLHGYYTALETLCERVARQLDEVVPQGASWHADLLSQMQIEVPGLSPRVVPTEVVGELHELQKFQVFPADPDSERTVPAPPLAASSTGPAPERAQHGSR